MSLEIRELVIKVTIEDTAVNNEPEVMKLADMKKAIIKECIEEVFMKLENRSNR